jgi:hypothetical protein
MSDVALRPTAIVSLHGNPQNRRFQRKLLKWWNHPHGPKVGLCDGGWRKGTFGGKFNWMLVELAAHAVEDTRGAPNILSAILNLFN